MMKVLEIGGISVVLRNVCTVKFNQRGENKPNHHGTIFHNELIVNGVVLVDGNDGDKVKKMRDKLVSAIEKLR